MTGTNVDYYCAAFDADGNRIYSSICDFDPAKEKNAAKIQALKDKAKESVSDAAVIEIISTEDFNEYLNGKVRGSDGKPTEYVTPEPTAEEKAAAEKAQIDSDYNASVADLQASLQIAQLNNDADAIASIQAEKVDLDATYKDAIAAAEGSDK